MAGFRDTIVTFCSFLWGRKLISKSLDKDPFYEEVGMTKQTFSILLAIFLVMGMLSPVYAYEVTVYDGKGTGTGLQGAQEFHETEPGTLTDAFWDIGGLFVKTGTQTLYAVTAFNAQTGPSYNGGNFPTGDLFIKIGSAPQLVTTGINSVLPNSTYGTYTFVVGTGVAGSTWSGATMGQVLSLVDNSQLRTATDNYPYGGAVDGSNPWTYVSGGTSLTPTSVTFGALNNTLLGQGVGTAQMLSEHYNFVSYDLSFLSPTQWEMANFQLTYMCGNDDVHGKVPIPPTALLLGSGLLGLAGLRRFRKN